MAYDRRGHGRSEQPATGYDYDTLADDMASVIEVLDLHDLTLVGHSMGAAEIVRYLTRHGDARVRRIVLLAPVLPFLTKTADNPDGIPAEMFESWRAAWRNDFPKWVTDNAAPFFAPDTSAAFMTWGVEMLLKSSLPVAIACNRSVAETDFRAELPRIRVPTLLLQGDKDASAPLALTGAQGGAAHSRLPIQDLPRSAARVDVHPHGAAARRFAGVRRRQRSQSISGFGDRSGNYFC